MTTKDDFTEEEWQRLQRAPIVAGMAITLADPGGPIEAVKESVAAVKRVTEVAQSGAKGDLAEEVARSVTEERQNPMGDFKPKGAMAGEEIVEELRAVNELLSEKASPEDAAGFRGWLLSPAQR